MLGRCDSDYRCRLGQLHDPGRLSDQHPDLRTGTIPLCQLSTGLHAAQSALLGILLLLLIYFSGKLRNWIVGPLLTRPRMEFGARQTTGTIIRYLSIAIGFSAIFQTAGIDLNTLNVLVGAVGIGLGFGLQNIVNNSDVLADPAPGIRLMAFAESGLAFELRVWSTSLIQRRGLLIGALNLAILESFRSHGVVLPYPRQDGHLVAADIQRPVN